MKQHILINKIDSLQEQIDLIEKLLNIHNRRIIYHGGCLNCIADQSMCHCCQYKNADWQLPDLSTKACWKPENNKVFYYIEKDGEVWKGCFDWNEHRFMYRMGNCFPTKEEAEPHRDIMGLIYKCSPEKLKQIREILSK